MKKKTTDRPAGSRRAGCLSAFGIIIFLVLGGWIWFQHELTPVDYGDRSAVQVTVPAGASVRDIGIILVDRGLIRSAKLFFLAAQMSGKDAQLQAGTYALSRAQSVGQMIDLMASGQTDSLVVVVPEGFTAAQIADRLASQHLCDKLAFLKVVATGGEQFSFADGLAPPRNLEGYLYPLTYTVLRKSSPRDIARQMLDGFDHNVFSLHPEVHDWRPVLIVASMIEREALIDSDRPLIASVLYNRLRIGMPLQCDATVQYALPEHKDRLMYSDLRIDSPYNTYLHRGLPPGPICNPGLASIEAAIHPASTDYLFYVAGPGGAHVFSRTLAEQDREIAVIRSKT